ncbi:mechanosensitive ion channel [Parasulfuritortus cantonensis]|uniref:Mechanosensitive ion channel n=1 Tax=Parasulfuritortus cantonensis TaxID=2528202 RepID=A0A4R1B884_9PROT|nr:mechanosensitive ion channel domain-containing protein [Parasulfuritortus cantonensis]TCJ12263.1 mechanosensitive ion channel [Parasulfuritortus cantonensis]
MTMPAAEPPVENLVDALLSDLSNTVLLSQGAILVVALALAWLVLRHLVARLSPVNREAWHADEWPRFMIPVLTLLAILVSRPLLALSQTVHLFNLAVPLLLSMFIIQFSFFLLRTLFNPGAGLRTAERSLSWLVWGVVALHITGHLGTLVAGMDAVGFSIGKQHISLYTALLGLASVAVTMLGALSAGRLIEGRLIAASHLNGNLKVVLSKLVRALLLVFAVLIALPLVGIDITVLSVFGGALGVGLGLGLQKIASNYVSGFSLLIENSLRIGDMIEVEGRYGKVTEIATRYTVLRAQDGTESIIPNETLITATVINHSLTDKNNRVHLPIQVGYGSDLARVREIMLAAAAAHPRVLKAPAPVVLLKDFGESGIDMELALWIDTPDAGEVLLRSDLNWTIWEAFQRENIEIPFPQRVVHLVNDGAPASA